MTIAGVPVEDSYQSPPIVLDTNVLVAGACRHESSLAYLVLLGILEQTFPIFLTEPIVLEYLDVLARPRVRALTGLTRRQSEALVTDLTALSRTVQLRFSWRPNLRDDLKQKAQQLAKEQGVSLNGFINATLAAAVAQQETLTFFSDRLRDVDQDALHKRVLKFMRNTRSGKEPSIEEIERAMRG